MQKDTWPVEKLALAVTSAMIVRRGSKSHTQTNNAVETTDFDRPHHRYQTGHNTIPGLGNFDIVPELRTFAMDAA